MRTLLGRSELSRGQLLTYGLSRSFSKPVVRSRRSITSIRGPFSSQSASMAINRMTEVYGSEWEQSKQAVADYLGSATLVAASRYCRTRTLL